jgi:hypothetical protein
MSKFDEKVAIYTKAMQGYHRDAVDIALFTKVTKGLGPSIYLEDASRVGCSDQTEKDRVKNNFLIKKMGLTDSPALDAAVSAVCEEMGSSNRDKFRANFYYILVKKLGLEAKYA